VLGYPLAYFLARALPRVQALCLFLLIMPLMVSAVIRVFGWIVILGRKGLANQALAALGLEPVRLLYSETAVVIGLINIFVPFMVLPIMASIERIPPSLEEAAQNLGANWYQMFWRTILPLSLPGLVGLDPRLEEAAMSLGATRVQAFFKVTLPLLRSSLLSGAIFAFIISFSDINLALFLSGPESTSLPVHIFSQIQWQGDPTIAAASSLQIVIIGMLILLVQRIFRLRLIV
jgi:ABC-type spermidine/putrescine transport system permease subunit I